MDSDLRVIKRKCGSWLCPHCKPHMSMMAKTMLYSNLKKFECPQLLTLTVNPSAYIDASDAYAKVREGKFIPRILRYMKVNTWVSVMEFQKNGFPHWHLLVDIGRCPSAWVKKRHKGKIDVSFEPVTGYHKINHWLDYERLHRLWGEKWQLGTHATVSKVHKVFSPRYAVNYILKYLFKNPENGYPDWVWSSNNLKIFTHSNNLDLMNESIEKDKKGGKGEVSKAQDEETCVSDDEDETFVCKNNRERVSSCSSDFVVFDNNGNYLDTFVGFGREVMNTLAERGYGLRKTKFGSKFRMSKEMYSLMCDLDLNEEFQSIKADCMRARCIELKIPYEVAF